MIQQHSLKDSTNSRLKEVVRGALLNIGDFSFLKDGESTLEHDVEDQENSSRASNKRAIPLENYIREKKKPTASLMNRQMRSVTLKTTGITDNKSKALVERTLISIKGVISITIDSVRF